MQNIQGSEKAQSAMEYLTTYGWAILIISAVLIAFYSLGIFNPYAFAPKAQTGGCYIYNPYLYGSSGPKSLEGTCNNDIPQFISVGNGYAQVYIPSNMPTLKTFTFVGWVDYRQARSGQGGGALFDENECGLYLPVDPNDFYAELDTCNCRYTSNNLAIGCDAWATAGPLLYNKWYMVALTVDSSGDVNTYTFTGTNSVSTASSTIAQLDIPTGPSYIGSFAGSTSNLLNGSISNIQVYNATLSQSDLASLYNEGIGGVPINLQNLVGWWPLDGNANDYSGNNYNGDTSNIIFRGSWWNSYSAP